MSRATLESMGIKNPNAKAAFMRMHFSPITSEEHYQNIVNYIKRKTVLYENEGIKYLPNNRKTVCQKIREMKNKPKHTPEEMAEFRHDYPQYNSWKKTSVQLRLSKSYTDELQSLEDQRMKEDQYLPLSKDEIKKLVPFKKQLEWLRDQRIKLAAHPDDAGYAVIFSGRSGSFKTTFAEILAMSFGAYHSWPGTMLVKDDILKYDSAARAQIDTIIIEECKWISLHRKITLDDSLCTLKEQLSGTGLNVRLAKNKSSIDDLQIKIERFFISFNPDCFVDYATLNNAINAKAEFKRRFYIYDMDSMALAGLYQKPKEKWLKEYRIIAAKLIRNNQDWSKFLDMCDKEEKNSQEEENVLSFIENTMSDGEEEPRPPTPEPFVYVSDDEEDPPISQSTINKYFPQGWNCDNVLQAEQDYLVFNDK